MPSDAALIDADRQARADALDVTRSFIVQAPAGSGKTELLIQRYLKLLATVENPEEVVAITFTRKAAREMQQRVSKALLQAKKGMAANFEHEQTTLDAATAVLAKDAEYDWELIKSPRRMRIQTLDALCASIARLVPITSGIGGIGNTIVNAEVKTIYRQAAIATLDWLLVDDEMSDAVENVLTHLDNNTGAYVSYVSRMLETRDQWLGITGTGQIANSQAVRAVLEKNISDLVRDHLRAVVRQMQSADIAELPSLASYAGTKLHECGKSDHVAAILAETSEMPGFDDADLQMWRGIAELLLTKNGTWRKTVNKNDGFPVGDKGQKKSWLQIISDLSIDHRLWKLLAGVRLLPDPRYEDSQWEALQSLLKLLPLAAFELSRIFGEKGQTDHSEVAQAAESALGSPDEPGEIALMLDYRIRHLLVDEMQDTSIGQYRLLEKLTAGWESGDGRSLFCVGDPMQSIYRFRNAEVGQFVLAREVGVNRLPLESLTLRQNFRSGENLVHWFNTVFDQILPDVDDIATGAIKYSESVPVPGLHDAGEYHIYPSFNASIADEASSTAAVIKGCLSRSDHEDVVVLVRSRTQLTLLLEELRKDNVAYHAVEIDRLTDLPEVIDMLALTRAFCHSGDRTAWLGLLRGPLVGLAWADIHQLVLGAPGETVWNLIRDEERVSGLSIDAQELLRRLNQALKKCFATDRLRSLRSRIESAWFCLGGPGHLQDRGQLDNVFRFLDVLDTIEIGGTLADPAELEQRLDNERVSSHAAADCRLQVMTIHKSKGLEFDHVVMPGLGRSTSGNKKSVLSWLNIPDDSNRNDMIISPVGPSAELEKDLLHQYIESRQQESNRLELDRLLYVACTRARKSLHLIGHVNTTGDGKEMRPPISGSLLHRLWPALASDYSEAFEKYAGPDAPLDPDGLGDAIYRAPTLKRAHADWIMPDPPKLPQHSSEIMSQNDVEDRPVEFYWVGTMARHTGTIVHRWLHQFVDVRKWPIDGQFDAVNASTRHWARDLRVSEDDLDFVCDRVRAALSGILEDARGRWILNGEGHAELALTGLWQKRAESIVIDRVRIDDQGNHWIVDYKTSTHEGGDLRGFLRQEADRYRPQLEKYTTIYSNFAGVPVKAALYFPLLQQFLEVNVTGH